jgi:hypothetical protein
MTFWMSTPPLGCEKTIPPSKAFLMPKVFQALHHEELMPLGGQPQSCKAISKGTAQDALTITTITSIISSANNKFFHRIWRYITKK